MFELFGGICQVTHVKHVTTPGPTSRSYSIYFLTLQNPRAPTSAIFLHNNYLTTLCPCHWFTLSLAN